MLQLNNWTIQKKKSKRITAIDEESGISIQIKAAHIVLNRNFFEDALASREYVEYNKVNTKQLNPLN